MPENPLEKPERTERDMHQLFQVLRDHVVEVVGDFEEGLNRRIKQLDERPLDTAPSARSIATQFGVQVMNLLSGLLAPDNDDETDDES